MFELLVAPRSDKKTEALIQKSGIRQYISCVSLDVVHAAPTVTLELGDPPNIPLYQVKHHKYVGFATNIMKGLPTEEVPLVSESGSAALESTCFF